MGHTATILGASGFSGSELLRLLAGHPGIEIGAVAAGRSVGLGVEDVQPHLQGWVGTFVSVDEAAASRADVCFSCLPSGELGKVFERIEAGVIVDLSDEHRAHPDWVYGLTEFARDGLPASKVANPGCYPTATLLALMPFARSGSISGTVVVDALSGVSGAGREPADHLMFTSMFGDAKAYGTTDHRHVPEMEAGLRAFGGLDASVSFTPHLIPAARGLLVTARARLTGNLSDGEAIDLLRDAYEAEPFVQVLDSWPAIKPVGGSNSVHVSARVDSRNGWLIASAALDNLGKGAAGQAIQNANLCLGSDETLGLGQVALWP